jgi:carboxymethylenebutenolidase
MMRFLIIIPIVFLAVSSFAQKITLCCLGNTANAEFVAFAGDNIFKSVHQTPRIDTLENPLGKMIGIRVPADSSQAYGYFIAANQPTDKVLFVFHEWWGMNDNIKREADKYYTALEGAAHVLAIDLFDNKKATDREKAAKLMEEVSEERIHNILEGAFALVGNQAKFAMVGWCFGGTWSLQAALLAGEQALACVTYYGMPENNPANLENLSASVLGIYADQDGWITPEIVNQFEKEMKEAGKNLEIYRYDAEHAFANPSNPQYNEDATKDAFEKSITFLKAHLSE